MVNILQMHEDNCFVRADLPELLWTQLRICLLQRWIHHGHWDVWNYCPMMMKTFCTHFQLMHVLSVWLFHSTVTPRFVFYTNSMSCTVRRPTPVMDDKNEHTDIGNGVLLEKIDKFCYLGDVLNADGGCNSAVTARVRFAYKTFWEYLPILTAGKGFLLKLKGKVQFFWDVKNCLKKIKWFNSYLFSVYIML